MKLCSNPPACRGRTAATAARASSGRRSTAPTAAWTWTSAKAAPATTPAPTAWAPTPAPARRASPTTRTTQTSATVRFNLVIKIKAVNVFRLLFQVYESVFPIFR